MIIRNILNLALLSALMWLASPSLAMEKIDKLVVSGPLSNVSYPLIHMMETQALGDITDEIEFVSVRNPDQARLMALGKGKHQADFMAMPSNVAAILYNKGVNLKLMNVSVWGILWMVSRDAILKQLSDFKGKEIAVPYRADMSDIVFQQVVQAEGLDIRKDLVLRYTAHPLDAMQLLMLGQVNHALLADPAISMALRKSQKMAKKTGNSPLYRSVDIQKAWGKVFKRQPKIPQLGMVALSSVLEQPLVLQRFQQEYTKSVEWCLQNPELAGKMAAKHLDGLTPQAIADSLRRHLTTD